jgi:hypothetical protein
MGFGEANLYSYYDSYDEHTISRRNAKPTILKHECTISYCRDLFARDVTRIQARQWPTFGLHSGANTGASEIAERKLTTNLWNNSLSEIGVLIHEQFNGSPTSRMNERE